MFAGEDSRSRDTEFLLDEQVDRFRFQDENERVKAEDGNCHRQSAASWNYQGFAFNRLVISAASFQENPVLTEAAISGRVDICGLKENSSWRLIPPAQAWSSIATSRSNVMKHRSGRRDREIDDSPRLRVPGIPMPLNNQHRLPAG